MSENGPVMRGCRPSRVSGRDNDSECEVIRLANLERYVLRARAGLPIFDEPAAGELGPAGRSVLGRPNRRV